MRNGTGNKCSRFLVIVLLLLLISPGAAYSWGRIGHRVAARMAADRLTPSARKAVEDILGKGVRLADAASWADEQQEIPESSRWHYVNVPLQETAYDPKFCPSSGCVVSKIKDFKDVLRNPKASRTQKQQALKFLIHLIADLHQPLHVGDKGDKGGNLLQVRFYGEDSNLHRVWDSQLIEKHTAIEQVWLWELAPLARPQMAEEWSSGAAEDWAGETLTIAREAYRWPNAKIIKPGARLGDPYFAYAFPILKKQLAKSGIRTAFVLNEIFK